jgi:predicted ATPase/DNA-binding CsgD family transcriptional regulator
MVALPIEQLATRLDERFRLLVGGSRTAHRRHRTLQASVDWSYELLETDERQLFERLSVFVDGFGLEAAEAICGADGLQPEAVLGLVRLLVEKSLVGADLGSIDARYRLLETLRLYAWERLLKSSLAEATQTRHAAYYLAFAARAVQSLHGPEREMWLHRLERDQGNLRAALRSFGDRGDAHACLQLVLALSPFWDASGWFEVTLPISRAGPPAARAEALEATGTVAWYRGDLATAASLLDASLVLRRQLGDNDGAVSALNRLGVVARERGDTTGASALFEEALANSYQHGNDPGMANALHNLGLVASDRGDFERAAQLYGAADALSEHNPNVMPRADRTTRERNIPELRAQLGDEAFDLAWATGRDMSVEHVIPRAQTAAMVPGELASSYADLTPRELEVLQLIASGLSNREIAERLVLSARTVERHITNLYGKIAVRGKAGATAYALRHGLAAN